MKCCRAWLGSAPRRTPWKAAVCSPRCGQQRTCISALGTFGEYIGRLFGYGPRSSQEKLRVAEALEGLPGIAAALEQGSLNWSAVRELTRVAVAETEREWLEVARGKTVHQLEALVAGRISGDRPSAPARPDARRHVLRFEVTPETLCLFREAMSKLRRSSRAPLDDDSALMLLARHVLAGPSDEGRASYQIALSICPQSSSSPAAPPRPFASCMPMAANTARLSNQPRSIPKPKLSLPCAGSAFARGRLVEPSPRAA